MSQPTFALIAEADKVRPAYHLQTPHEWRATVLPMRSRRVILWVRRSAFPGPIRDTRLLVAEELFADRLELSPGVSTKDALYGCCAVVCARGGAPGTRACWQGCRDGAVALRLPG